MLHPLLVSLGMDASDRAETLQQRNAKLRALYQNFQDDPGTAGDRYVDTFSGNLRGADPVRKLYCDVVLAGNRSGVAFFSAPRGSGKTSELKRLAKHLQTNEDGMGERVVVEVNFEHWLPLDVQPMVVDFYIAVVATVLDLVRIKESTNTLAREGIADIFGSKLDGSMARLIDKPHAEAMASTYKLDETIRAYVRAGMRDHGYVIERKFRSFMTKARKILSADDAPCPVVIVDQIQPFSPLPTVQRELQRAIVDIFVNATEKLEWND